MALYAAQGSVQPEIRLQALALTSGIPEKDYIGEVAALTAFVRDQIRYTRDVWGVETIHTPAAMLALRQGDCDDKATLLASLLMSIGFQVRFGLLNRKGKIVHVWTQVALHGRWIDLETTEQVPAGTLPPFAAGDKVETYGVKPHGAR